MIKKLLILLSMCLILVAETEFAEPKPSMFEQRKILFSINSAEDKKIHALLSTANNVLKFYGVENVHMRIVAYADGMKMLIQRHKDIALRVKALSLLNVEFVACGNTMRTKHIKKEDLIEDTDIVTAGVAELVERSVDGWTHIAP